MMTKEMTVRGAAQQLTGCRLVVLRDGTPSWCHTHGGFGACRAAHVENRLRDWLRGLEEEAAPSSEEVARELSQECYYSTPTPPQFSSSLGEQAILCRKHFHAYPCEQGRILGFLQRWEEELREHRRLSA